MTVYILRYPTEDERAYRNEAFTSRAAWNKRLSELKIEVQEMIKYAKEANDPPPPEETVLNYTEKTHITKVVVKNTADLIKLISKL